MPITQRQHHPRLSRRGGVRPPRPSPPAVERTCVIARITIPIRLASAELPFDVVQVWRGVPIEKYRVFPNA
jgi:hypothetical protein